MARKFIRKFAILTGNTCSILTVLKQIKKKSTLVLSSTDGVAFEKYKLSYVPPIPKLLVN